MVKRPDFTELYFGKSDGQNEAIEDPDAFIRSFVNPANALDQIVRGQNFLVLGPKGTGKSAIAWYLKQTERLGGYIVTIRDAATLPLADIPRIKTGQPSGAERTVTAWKFILLANYLELLLKDPSCSLLLSADVERVARALRQLGFTGEAAGKVVLDTATQTFKIPIPTVGEIYEREQSQELDIFHLTPHMERWVTRATSESRALLILDGLDSIFLNDLKYEESLSSLVQAAYNLNQSMRHHKAKGAIVVLMRNDVFARISSRVPDSQKMRDDQSLQLDWRVLSGSQGLRSPLLQLVNGKAARSVEEPFIDVMSYFDKDVQLGPPGKAPKWDPTLRYFLNLTRHTPRDLLRLFESIRQVQVREGLQSLNHIARPVIREGVQRYSSDYFVGAIKNEFAGFDRGPEVVTCGLNALQGIRKAVFSRDDFLTSLQHEIDGADLSLANELLRTFFMAGAIGNKLSTSNKSYLQFYHRRDDVQIYLRGQFILANPLTYAWSRSFGEGY